MRNFVRRYQATYNTEKWLDASKQFIYNRNRLKTRAHGEIPLDVMNDPQADYRALVKLEANEPRQLLSNGPKVKSNVRLSRIKQPFEKESTHKGNWSKEIYTVSRVDETKERPMYALKDFNGEPVRGKAYR